MSHVRTKFSIGVPHKIMAINQLKLPQVIHFLPYSSKFEVEQNTWIGSYYVFPESTLVSTDFLIVAG
jgi:hypothetical protein